MTLCLAAASGIYDSMAHPDLAKVFGQRPDRPQALYRQIADAFQAAGVCAEVSSAGYRQTLDELYPDPELLAMLHERGVPVTLGSDAHAPERVGRDFPRALAELLRRRLPHADACSTAANGGRRCSMSERLRVGIGFDAHAFADGRRLVLAGVEIPSARGLAGHSDADLISHAVTDALLGAAGGDDIGDLYPSDDPALAGASSVELLRRAWATLAERGWSIVNVDAIVIMQEPRLAPHRAAMREALAAALEVVGSG